MNRRQLAHRRPNMTVETEWNGHPLTVTVGFNPRTGKVAEVFADSVKGGQMQDTLRDACVIISVALQFGISVSDVSKSLGTVPDLMRGGGYVLPASPIGAIMSVVIKASGDAENAEEA